MSGAPEKGSFAVRGRAIAMPFVAALALAATVPAHGQEPAPQGGAPELLVELNKLEAQGDACRAFLLFENSGDQAYTSLKLDLVLFDAGGVIERRLLVEGAPIAAEKTIIKQFDLTGLPCDGIGRVLLNDITACETAAGPRQDCIGTVQVASRAPAPLVK
ncbi:Tat pathway signal sequence domain protein [Marinivivus vitaminiproducens]|uniref:Tat pathway signal sequence domain protein n=1 Tax=Marinivivus vitaminiproducens TaxID=3035935 RepID=UPI0027A53AA8|nr:Tat pathway signal sequence domain protein [Geminicoccaceae bacterium SCSIO 64248]